MSNTGEYLHASNAFIDEESRLRYQAGVSERFLWEHTSEMLQGLGSNQNVLEVGSGVSAQTEHLIKRLPIDSVVHCIDINSDHISKAKQFLHNSCEYFENIRFHVMDALNTCFDDQVFDGVYISWVLEHLAPSNQEKLLNEVYRVLKPGGWVIINEIDLTPHTGVYAELNNGTPGILYSYLKCLSKIQSSLGGNSSTGSIENLSAVLGKSSFETIQIKHLSMAYESTHPEFNDSIQDGINLFSSLERTLAPEAQILKGTILDLTEEFKKLTYIDWRFGQAVLNKLKERKLL